MAGWEGGLKYFPTNAGTYGRRGGFYRRPKCLVAAKEFQISIRYVAETARTFFIKRKK